MNLSLLLRCLPPVLLCAVRISAGENSVLAEQLAWIAPLSGPTPADGRPVCVPLPRRVIAATASRFADLRVFDDRGGEVPYVIYGHTPERLGGSRHAFRVVDYEPQSQTLTLERPSGRSSPFDRLELKTGARNFYKRVTVYGSDDGESWRELSRDAVFDFSRRVDLRRTILELPEERCRHLRLVMADEEGKGADETQFSLVYRDMEFKAGEPPGPFKIDGVEGWLSAREAKGADFDQMTIVNPPRRQDEDKITWVEMGEINLPLTKVELSISNAYFHRRITVQTARENKPEAFRDAASGTIYRVPGMNRAWTELSCALPRCGWMRLRIHDGDSPPLAVESVTLRWARQNLYFVPEPERRYEARFGGKDIAAPAYDLAALLPPEQERLRGLADWQLGEIQPNSAYKPPEAKPDGGVFAFYTILTALALGLALWLYRLARDLPPPGASPPE